MYKKLIVSHTRSDLGSWYTRHKALCTVCKRLRLSFTTRWKLYFINLFKRRFAFVTILNEKTINQLFAEFESHLFYQGSFRIDASPSNIKSELANNLDILSYFNWKCIGNSCGIYVYYEYKRE